MEPGTRPSTARQALPERPPVAGPSRPRAAARLALRQDSTTTRSSDQGQRETAPGTKTGGRQSPGAVSIVFLGHARGQPAPCTSTTCRPTEAPWPSVGATLADRWPSMHSVRSRALRGRERQAEPSAHRLTPRRRASSQTGTIHDLAVGRRTSYRRGQSTSGPRVLGPGRTRGTGRASARPVLRGRRRRPRLVTGDCPTIESPGPTGDACSDAKSAFAKTSTARPWGGTQEPAGPQSGRFFALERPERPGVNSGVVPATGSPRSSPR